MSNFTLPKTADGRLQFFPGAPAPDNAAHRERMFQHVVAMASSDVRYARWAAGELAKGDPELHGDVLDRLDIDLAARRVKLPAPYVEPETKVPALAKGRRGLPQRKFWSATP